MNNGITAAYWLSGRWRGPYTLKYRIETVSSRNSSQNTRQYCSPATFETAYGERGTSGAVSGVGRISAPPYTDDDDAATTRRTPASRLATSTVRVPPVFARSVASGCSTLRNTARWAAWWKTTSQPATARATASGSATSPSTSSAAGLTYSSWPVERSSRTTTSRPVGDETIDQVRADEPGPSGH